MRDCGIVELEIAELWEFRNLAIPQFRNLAIPQSRNSAILVAHGGQLFFDRVGDVGMEDVRMDLGALGLDRKEGGA